MTRVFSGVKPTGHLTLGNYLGAMRRWAAVDQHRSDALFCVVDLHALTVDHDPARVRRLSRQAASLLLAAGLDPELCTVFVQSHVDEHARLSYVLECVATDGEMRRMIQYKEKAARERVRGGSVRLSLLTYPVLMAADILAYGTDEVPVGEDQTQHVELARDLAVRFNQRYGHTFVVPRATSPAVAARVMNLQEPASKMGKSDDTGPGIVYLLDEPDVVRKKVMRAVTDSGRDVVYDPEERAGLANLLEILAACTDGEPAELAGGYDSYGALKKDTAEAVVEMLRPVRERHMELSADPGYVDGVLREGAEKARAMARPTVDDAYRAIGLLPPVNAAR
ncbi:tryptophan--tRNA ligase [Streptomyces violaceoruber]|uniref:Tryptophan--tRNA ligase 1 n=6 Tax=Streptomyces TaxID=1883 RepID=SYW1_STRCO|nr:MULTISPECIES: tryptophan--tRNA ligase [Streptomyces]Q8CJX0.1 RecName: Full=Tryptophan--tRNA ligase 1; AltName: Full=Tryptophanyl-tRNA synthetase 1; Short=TrpRS 1 [Streptomyces coelicolor A3(2)]QSJ10727.1 Tryptophan-tRNA ligase 1 [Streptomyces lividans]WOY99886.1 tryptophan--tRNA ligase [Streptomyces violaceoruber]AIJ15165.1 Tryptophan-tRNA ligase 1 [Streptomyces lividans TK24]EFD68580.1 tryptophanyl-tRNA synthetase [Streptomyces lividans TK24]EOY48390.1 Tryptophanyl-tRNA synthetase [Strept